MMILEAELDTEGKIERCPVDYENLSSRFLLKTRTYRHQYAHIYSTRLQILRGKLTQLAKQKWGDARPIKKLFELDPDDKEVVVIGTLYKEMELKPSILKEISEEHYLAPQPVGGRFTSSADVLILEDELQRIVLLGDIDKQSVVTGVVVAVLGEEQDGGKFLVKDTLFLQPAIQSFSTTLADDRYVVLTSGFGFGSNTEALLNIKLFVDFLIGLSDECDKISKIVRVIVAGGSVGSSVHTKDIAAKAKYLIKGNEAASVDAIQSLDRQLGILSSTVEVDVMPGEFDPSNHLLPQQPFHQCMFPEASAYQTFNRVTNPYDATIEGVRFLGCSGQNVDDIYRYSGIEDRLDILEATLKWGHLAPTAPDTLGMYPYYDEDPFIIDQCPQVYFAGCQPSFQFKIIKDATSGCMVLVTVPKYSESFKCVLVNLRTLSCEPLVVAALEP